MPIIWFTKRRLAKAAQRIGADFVDLKNRPDIAQTLEKNFRDFKTKAQGKKRDLGRVLKTLAARKNLRGDQATSFIYDTEYGGHYSCLTALLSKPGFKYITGYDERRLASLKILDVGAGSNELLRFCHAGLGVPKKQLFGSDLSPVSQEIIERDGFKGYAGRIENLPLAKNSFDLIFLSYFIDYDTNQKSTFYTAMKLVRPGGKIIFEGLLPCRPASFLNIRQETKVAKGENAAKDIINIVNFFHDLGLKQNKKIQPKKIIRGSRYVYSRHGLNKLPSYFIVLKVNFTP